MSLDERARAIVQQAAEKIKRLTSEKVALEQEVSQLKDEVVAFEKKTKHITFTSALFR